MSRMILARYLNPRKYRREQERLQRVAELRERDGDDCRRCRRPIRLDLPDGHDHAPLIEQIAPGAAAEPPPVDNLCLTHTRCNAAGADHTAEVQERVRRKGEAEWFAR